MRFDLVTVHLFKVESTELCQVNIVQRITLWGYSHHPKTFINTLTGSYEGSMSKLNLYS